MTLLRQLIIVIITLFALLFAGSVIINVNNTRTYLNNQLRSISEDMATSLGMSLSPHMAKGEMTIVESMINAVSDSGYYREVIVTDVNGKALIERIQPLTIEGVPEWFVKLIPLETPRGEAMIMAGWIQAGNIRISANPGYAYSTMWNNSVQAFWWFLGSSVFAFVLGVIALNFVLRPLRAVEAQAKAICDREYTVQGSMPWTLELRSVVGAMNRMTTKVKDMFEEQANAMERVRTDAYIDNVTGLANRSYFDMQLRHLIQSPEGFDGGAVLFLELNDFKSFNERKGYQSGDKLLRACGALISDICKGTENLEYFAARLAGPNFGIVVSHLPEKDVLALAEKIGSSLIQLHENEISDVTNIGHIGVAIFRGQAVGPLLSEADLALRAAQVKGPNAAHMNDSKTIDDFGSYSATRWKDVLQKALTDRSVALHRQPTVGSKGDGQILHYETLLRVFTEEGKMVPPGVLIPMAKRLHLIQDFDKYVVTEVLDRLKLDDNKDISVAVNLFPLSILDTGFVTWLSEKLHQYAEVAPRIAFEVTEQGVMENLDALRGWVERVVHTGAKVGLDQFGKGFTSFNYLSALKLDYVKIDGSYIRGIHENKDNQFFVDSLVKVAHGLDIQVIAESVETQEEWETLKNLRVDGVKGYGVGRPELWS